LNRILAVVGVPEMCSKGLFETQNSCEGDFFVERKPRREIYASILKFSSLEEDHIFLLRLQKIQTILLPACSCKFCNLKIIFGIS